jgi:glycosyltransferase involved in cell wall biosynthesis
MRILVLSPELFLADGGIARIMRLYLKTACQLCGPDGRVDSLVLNDQPGRDDRLARYANERLAEHLGCGGHKLRFITRAIKLGRKADLLICGHLHHLAIARLVKLFNPRLKYCLVAHGIEVWRPYSWIERRALLGAHRILCVSEYTRHQLLRFLPTLAAARVVVVPNTLDPYFSTNALPGGLAVPFAGPRVLTVSRLTIADNYKGIDTLIEALPLVKRDYPFVQLRIVGRGDDLPRLTALAARLGVAGAVEFTGALSDEALRAEYATCDIFALPSRREGFGLVFLEAMTYGKPCIAARAGGAPEVVNDDVGQLVEYGNIPALAAAVADLTQHPRDSEVVRRHAAAFAFPMFQQRLAAALH